MDLYKKADRKFRLEIEGLRAVASILVAVYHIWLGNVSGGVDVFFVVAGFLITTSLLGRYERSGKIDFSGFILRLMKRLFPAAFTVLFITGIACIIWLPEVRWAQTVQELLAAALYFENWQLAINSVDYLAQNNEASPFQHFWAMSLQGQFYIIWPLLLFITILLARFIFKKQVRPVFFGTLIVVFFISFGYSIYMTDVNQPWAYFDTFTRVWEFSAGGLLALLIANIKVNKSLSFVLSWLGLIGLVSCGLVLQVSTVFPGYAALWPVLSAIFILIAGNQGGKYSAYGLLSSKPLIAFGGISYGFYLWHWPILIFYFLITGNETASLVEGLLIMVLSAILAYVTTEFVEKPIRNRKSLNVKWKTATVAVLFLLPVLVLSGFWSQTIAKQQNQLADMVNEEDYPGAAVTAFAETSAETDEPVVPTPVQARNDQPDLYADGCHQAIGETEVIECIYGETENPEYTVALVGGSHSAHWLPALQGFAEEEKIQINSYTKSGCRFSTEEFDAEDCTDWNTNLMDVILELDPDLVFTTADVTQHQEVPDGYVEAWEILEEHDIQVFAVRDNPRFTFDVPSCVEENGPDSIECAVEQEEILPAEAPWDQLENPPANVHYADFTDRFCEDGSCKAVVGNVLVYTDSHHITATYSSTLAPFVRDELVPLLK
ncbi:acyltransferase family protein [Oceanobacillus alkalisoli]|uniref:acyltransferase family protein n=1 Tax=Oceanobacillus alkalisoli TaxID=2925113 RepID=UPI001EF07E15|nr:acyltransferase family protein [Oceanobacillus alkalisoli]MCF3942682.1 acyltransferase [Oceanobacillus alkalisoli]MCG5102654.1 acyltransferase [Oceanobacillus alkalisoli]